jgi:hypothetical protein
MSNKIENKESLVSKELKYVSEAVFYGRYKKLPIISNESNAGTYIIDDSSTYNMLFNIPTNTVFNPDKTYVRFTAVVSAGSANAY